MTSRLKANTITTTGSFQTNTSHYIIMQTTQHNNIHRCTSLSSYNRTWADHFHLIRLFIAFKHEIIVDLLLLKFQKSQNTTDHIPPEDGNFSKYIDILVEVGI